MNIRDLEYFDCVCNEKSFTKAAEKLFISQPSISFAIKRLESELNSKLIIRNQYSKELKITNEGLIFRKRVKNILSEMNEAKAELLKCKSKKIKLGIPPIIGTYFFPKFANYFSSHEFVENVEFVQCGSKKMKDMLMNGSVDLALIGSLNPILDEHISSKVLATDHFVMCLSKNNPILNDPNLNFSKLNTSQFIVLGEGNIHSSVLEKLFKDFNITDSKVCHIDEVQTAKSLIAADFGVGILAKMAVQDLKGIVTKDLKNPIPFYISIAMKKGHFLSDTEKNIMDIMTSTDSI